MFNKIIVALDLTENYTHLFDKALSLARATGAELNLVSVFTPRYDYGTSFRYYPSSAGYAAALDDGYWDTYQQEYTILKEAGFRTLSGLSNQAKAKGIQTEFFQMNGEPGTAICDLADTEKADLVIVGSHGRRGLEEFLMGSVSSYVVHRAPCSVMVVHHKLAQTEHLSEKMVETSAA